MNLKITKCFGSEVIKESKKDYEKENKQSKISKEDLDTILKIIDGNQ